MDMSNTWGMHWDPSYYYNDFVDWINSIFMWIGIGFLAIAVGGAIVIAVLTFRKYDDREDRSRYFTDVYCMFLWILLLAVIGIFGLLCVIRATPKYFGDMDYNLAGQWYSSGGLTSNNVIIIIVSILGIGAAIGIAILCFSNGLGFWSLLIAIGSGAAVYALALWAIGFVLYCVIWALWLVIRYIYLMIAGFGMAIGIFTKDHWIAIVATLGSVAGLIGLVTALFGYVQSFREEVYPERQGRNRYHPATATASAGGSSGSQRKKSTRKTVDEPIITAEPEPIVADEPAIAPEITPEPAPIIIDEPSESSTTSSKRKRSSRSSSANEEAPIILDEAPTPTVEPSAPIAAPTIEPSEDDGEATGFEGRIQQAPEEIRAYYDELRNTILSYDGIRSSMSKKGESFLYKTSGTVIKITLAGKTLKLYFALDPSDYDNSSITVLDVSDIHEHESTPLCFKVKSSLSQRRCLTLIDDCMNKIGTARR